MSYRLDTDVNQPIFAEFGQQKVRMRNISAGGVSFDYEQGKIGDKNPIHVTLPGRKGLSFSAQAEILTITHQCTCHCCLSDVSDDTQERIHQYVLQAQVHEQRRKRSNKDRGYDKDNNYS